MFNALTPAEKDTLCYLLDRSTRSIREARDWNGRYVWSGDEVYGYVQDVWATYHELELSR